MTSSARNSTDCGIVSPSAFAVLLLMTSSNRVGLSQRQLARPSAFQDSCNLLGRDRVNLRLGRAVGHETASIYEKTECVHGGQMGVDGEVGELSRPGRRAEDDVGR